MTLRTNMRFIVVFSLSLIFTTLAQEPKSNDQQKAPLTIEESGEPLSWVARNTSNVTKNGKPRKIDHPFGDFIIKPKYRAIFLIKSNNYYRNFYSDSVFKEIIKNRMSKTQQTFVSQGRYYYSKGLAEGVYDEYSLYAVSKEEIKKMIDAYFDTYSKRIEERINLYTKTIKEYQAKISTSQNIIQKNIIEKEELEKKLTEMKKTVYYTSTTEMIESIGNYNNVLGMLEIEIAGLDAKLNSINRQKKELEAKDIRVSQSIYDMTITLNAELAGALARQKTTRDMRQHAITHYELYDQLRDYKNLIAMNNNIISDQSGRLEKEEKKLAELPDRFPPDFIFENKVIIYPILGSTHENQPQ